MKKLIVSISIIFIIFLVLIIKPSFTGYSVYQKESEQKIKLGYCPTMQEEAKKLANENDYELINLGSATGALQALKNNQIDKALIGRKAEKNEINLNAKETTLKSGYTLVSNKKRFISYSELSSIEVYTSIENSFNFPVKKISEEEVLEKISEGKIALIYWEGWSDNFELIVVMDGNEKVKDFRGVFLYEN